MLLYQFDMTNQTKSISGIIKFPKKCLMTSLKQGCDLLVLVGMFSILVYWLNKVEKNSKR